jgi:biotin transporter BioY
LIIYALGVYYLTQWIGWETAAFQDEATFMRGSSFISVAITPLPTRHGVKEKNLYRNSPMSGFLQDYISVSYVCSTLHITRSTDYPCIWLAGTALSVSSRFKSYMTEHLVW